MVQVHLLGPVELSAGGRTVEVGPPQRRTVLAVLAVETGRPVTVAALIDRVWDAGPPDAARRAVHAHIAGIRRVCAQAGDRGSRPLPLLRRSSGYVLDADPEQVDVHRFRMLVDRAQAAEQPDDSRSALLRQALGLWRGEPLSGLHGQWAARMREAWRRQRVDAAVGWALIELRRGEPDTVIGPLTDLLAEYPLVEPLADMLMRALYDAGRGAEALDCFATVRRWLAEELGTPPGPALHTTHQSILHGHRPPPPSPEPTPPRHATPTPPGSRSVLPPAGRRSTPQPPEPHRTPPPADVRPVRPTTAPASRSTPPPAGREPIPRSAGRRSTPPAPDPRPTPPPADARPTPPPPGPHRTPPSADARPIPPTAAPAPRSTPPPADARPTPPPTGPEPTSPAFAAQPGPPGAGSRVVPPAGGSYPSPRFAEAQPVFVPPDPRSVSAWGLRERQGGEVPAQLPVGVRGFIGRDAEMARLLAILDDARGESPAVVISAVSGMAGVGKTALAVHWARRIEGEFPDGRLYVNLRGFDPRGSTVTPTEAVRGFLAAFGVRPEHVPPGLDAQVALYQDLLAGRRVLVVLDNAWDERQVRPLLPAAPGCMALVTSRNRLAGLAASDGAHLLSVDVLGPDAAMGVLAERIGEDRLTAEPDAAREIVAHCAGLPLALAVVAARAAGSPHRPLGTLARELREERNRLDALDAGEVAAQVRAVLSWSYRALSPGAARLFRLLGLHPGPDAGLAAVAALAGLPPSDTRELLSELTRGHLLSEHPAARYTFHDLLRVYAGELVAERDDEPVRRAALHRMLDHYLHTARAADALVTPQPNPIDLPPARPGAGAEDPADYDRALAWFAAECTVLLETVRQAPKGFEAHVWRLTTVVTTYLDRNGYWQALEELGRRATAAARLEHDRAGQAGAHRTLGLALDRLRQPEAAHEHYARALELYAALGDEAGQARTCQHLARLSGTRGDRRQALEHARRSLRHYRAAGDRAGQSAALNHMGWQLAHLGEHHRALTHCEQALALALASEDFNGLAHTWDSLGYIHRLLGHDREAVDCYRQAAELFHATGERNHEARCLTRLGDCYDSTHQPVRARDTWTRALLITDELGLPEHRSLRREIRQRLLR